VIQVSKKILTHLLVQKIFVFVGRTIVIQIAEMWKLLILFTQNGDVEVRLDCIMVL